VTKIILKIKKFDSSDHFNIKQLKERLNDLSLDNIPSKPQEDEF